MNADETIARIEQLILNEGLKATRSRRTIIKLFVESKEHLRPDQIYLKTRAEGISLPTVYRSIDILKKLNVIKEIVLHNERYYELDMYSQKKLHIHFQCNHCGRIKEYSNQHIFNELVEQRDYIEKGFDDEIQDIMVVMSGVCSDCKALRTSTEGGLY
jgi:Fe2+ or Zn2+ uptake regulation protein